MGANFTPTFGPFNPLTPFRFWCQKVLPLSYDDSLSYYELLNKVVDYLNKTMEDVETLHDDTDAMLAAFNALQTYVNTYFDELDLTEEVQTVLDRMAENGSLDELLRPIVGDQIGGVVAEQIDDAVAGQIYATVAEQINSTVIDVLNGSTVVQNSVEGWLNTHIPTGDIVVDNTLSISGAAADSAAVGNIVGNQFSIENNYTKGEYVLYSGVLYRFTMDHAAGAWTGTDATAVKIGGEIGDLKSAFIDSSIANGTKIPIAISTISVGGGVNPDSGANKNNDTKLGRVGSINFKKDVTLVCTSDEYEFTLWAYSTASSNSGTHGLGYFTNCATLRHVSGDNYFHFGFRRVDGADLTSDTSDPDSDVSKVYNSLYLLYNADEYFEALGKSADSKHVGEFVSSVSYTVDNSTLGDGYLSDGVLYPPDSDHPEYVEKYTPKYTNLKAARVQLKFSTPTSTFVRLTTFDKAGTFIEEINDSSFYATYGVDKFITVPQNAQYANICFRSFGATPKIQLIYDDDKRIDDNKNALSSSIQSTLYKQLDYELTIGSGVAADTGLNVNNYAKNARTAGVALETNRTIAVAILNSEYEFVAWCYSGASTSSATYSPTNSGYTQRWTFIPYTGTDRWFRIGIRRVDGAELTSGSESTTDESKLKAAIKILVMPQTSEHAWSVSQSNMLSKTGGVYHPYLRQGSGNFTNTYYVETQSLILCQTPKESLLYLDKGDVVDSDDLVLSVNKVRVTHNGIARDWIRYDVSPFTVTETGLYIIAVQNEDGTTILDANVAMTKTTVTHKGKRSIYNLPANPYKHIATVKDSDTGAYTWSERIHDIKSTCHLHTLRSYYFTRAVNSGYDHIAISNYHASKPTVPIAEIITELPYYNASTDVVPDDWLESPNAEHVYFEDADDYVGHSAGSHLHMNSVGSFVTSGADNTGVGEGGFGGTLKEFSEEAERLLKYPNAGGLTINHPAWSGIDADGIINLLSLGNVFGMEIYNANCMHATPQSGYALDLWDGVLAKGWQIFGTAVPDHETEGAFWSDHYPLGYVHLLCITKTEQEIMLAYRNGRSYCTIDNDTLLLKYFGIDSDGLVTFTASETGTIKFVTARGTTTVSNASTATYQTSSSDIFVRAEIETETNRLFTNAIML